MVGGRRTNHETSQGAAAAQGSQRRGVSSASLASGDRLVPQHEQLIGDAAEDAVVNGLRLHARADVDERRATTGPTADRPWRAARPAAATAGRCARRPRPGGRARPRRWGGPAGSRVPPRTRPARRPPCARRRRRRPRTRDPRACAASGSTAARRSPARGPRDCAATAGRSRPGRTAGTSAKQRRPALAAVVTGQRGHVDRGREQFEHARQQVLVEFPPRDGEPVLFPQATRELRDVDGQRRDHVEATPEAAGADLAGDGAHALREIGHAARFEAAAVAPLRRARRAGPPAARPPPTAAAPASAARRACGSARASAP